MEKIYLLLSALLCFCIIPPNTIKAQSCSSLTAQVTTYESRCAATGSVKITASGGSGSYKYKVTGPVNTNFTSTDSITGLAAGYYTVIVNDIVNNCTYSLSNVWVVGSYQDPRFTLNPFDVTCDNGNNGSIALNTQTFGRAPFAFEIAAPSPSGVGTTNNTGVFNNLSAGVYTIRMTDSCGGIQTRLVTINNYTWKIDSFSFRKISCDTASGSITASDSKGNISTVGGLSGFTFGVIRNAGDTMWSSNAKFSFYLGAQSVFQVIVKDPCGKIKIGRAMVNFIPSVAANITTSNVTCNSFSASITGMVNFFGANFCLYDSSNNQLACNATGKFDNLSYGTYCISAHDSCTDTTIRRCFSKIAPPVSLNNNVNVYNKICNSFSAAVTGVAGFTSPVFCLFDTAGAQIACNGTGVFDNLSYGSYCIQAKDGCQDTSISRCFTATKPRPHIPDVIRPGYTYCDVFGVVIRGDSLTNPLFCIRDTTGTILSCNNTGIFDSIPYGNYCFTIHDSCFDTTITRCIAVGGPVFYDDVEIYLSNQVCNTFTATATSDGLIQPSYCLYNAADSLMGCNTTGIFNNLPYGSYCLKSRNKCPDTTFTQCFTATRQTPYLAPTVNISNRVCNTFDANTTGGGNFTNPQYCLYDRANVLLGCNTTGAFTNIPYGNYYIEVKDGCYDTLIRRYFVGTPPAIRVTVGSRRSCAIGYAAFSVAVNGGTLPINVKIYKPLNGGLLLDRFYNSNPVSIDSIPATVAGQVYKIVAIDACGRKDSTRARANANIFSKSATVIQRCPSSNWVNGSGSIVTTASTNTGSLSVQITKKNNITLSPKMPPSFVASGVYTFNNLEPATYIVEYKANDGCNNYIYDTLTVRSYQYPNLNKSSAYQCDQNGFSIGAVVTNGIPPFSYEIIGSTPASPSINTVAQSNAVFNINNGTNYSLVRLRATDACGNASLEDASILPLANNGISATFNCFQLQTTLSVDTIYNSSYAWYLKTTYNNADSVLLGSASSVYIPNVLPADTGYYFCDISVYGGCIKRRYSFHLNGKCFGYLSLKFEDVAGRYAGDNVNVEWKMATNSSIKYFDVERKNANGSFVTIGRVGLKPGEDQNENFGFTDSLPVADKNYYRVKGVTTDGKFKYSDVVNVSHKMPSDFIKIYPNPVNDKIIIEFKNAFNHNCTIKLCNLINQVVTATDYTISSSNRLVMLRSKEIKNGIYVLRIFDKNTGEVFSQKLILE